MSTKQELIIRYELRLSQMLPYTKADAAALSKAMTDWQKAETKAGLQRKVSMADRAKLSELLKLMKRERQKRDNAHRHWHEAFVVAEQLVALGVEMEMPVDPTAPFAMPQQQSDMARRIQAAVKHVQSEAQPPRYDPKPPKRDAQGSNYSKQLRAERERLKAQQPDIPVEVT